MSGEREAPTRRRAMLLALALAPAAQPTAAQTSAEIHRYRNLRYGFSIDYPAGFAQARPAPPDGSGARFVSADGTAWFLAYAREHPAGPSVAEALREERALFEEAGTQITYRRERGRWFVISGYRRAAPETELRVLYYRVAVSADARLTTVLRIDYSVARRALYDPAVSVLSLSLRPAG